MHKTQFLQLKNWFLKEKRSFPWRKNRTPYAVWISEVMLQQTQALRVVSYFERWMRAFPTVSSLADAPFQEVIKLWEGLGYYSRVKAIYEAAKYFQAEHQGTIPDNPDILRNVKGFGPYTVDALSAFAFQKSVLALDANVTRVLARVFEIEKDVSKIDTKKHLKQLGEEQLPKKDGWIVAEALIELGATLCRTKNPSCEKCPLQTCCKSSQNKSTDRIPYKAGKTTYEKLFREVYVLMYKDEILLQKQQEGKIMAGLYEFPFSEVLPGGLLPEEVEQRIQNDLGITASFLQQLEPIFHSFTRFRVTLYPKIFEVTTKKNIQGYSWHPIVDEKKLTFSSGMKRVLQAACDFYREGLSTCKTL